VSIDERVIVAHQRTEPLDIVRIDAINEGQDDFFLLHQPEASQKNLSGIRVYPRGR